jgi:integrase/recombinase XerD
MGRPAPLDVADDPEGMPALIREFLDHLRVQNYAASTIDTRQAHLRRFTAWCLERGLTRPAEITRPILERYQRHLFHYRRPDGRPISFRSQAQTLTAVRGFFRHLARQNRLPMNPASELELPKEERRLPRMVLSVEEVEQILHQANVEDLVGLRDRAILETFYSTGIRRSELTNLAVYDIDTQRQTLFVRLGKGRKDRVVPIGERALAWVEKYLHEVRPALAVEPDPGHLFLSLHGGRIAAATLTDTVRSYVVQAGINKAGSCHLFRHTMATLMLEGGADIRFIQEMLGHANLQTTQVYTRVAIHKLKAIHDATHPGAKLRPAGGRAADAKGEAEREMLLASLAAEDDEE